MVVGCFPQNMLPPAFSTTFIYNIYRPMRNDALRLCAFDFPISTMKQQKRYKFTISHTTHNGI